MVSSRKGNKNFRGGTEIFFCDYHWDSALPDGNYDLLSIPMFHLTKGHIQVGLRVTGVRAALRLCVNKNVLVSGRDSELPGNTPDVGIIQGEGEIHRFYLTVTLQTKEHYSLIHSGELQMPTAVRLYASDEQYFQGAHMRKLQDQERHLGAPTYGTS